MADEQQQEVNTSRKSVLFPIIPSDSCESNVTQTRGLFPSVSGDNQCNRKESLDWLSNASYNTQAIDEIPTHPPENKEYESTSSNSSNEQETLTETKLDEVERNEVHEKKRRKKEKSKKHKKHKHKKHKKQKCTDDEKLTKLPATIWIEESGLEFEKAFRIHRNPDHENRQFGGLYRLDIALHNKNPKLKCLGLTKQQGFLSEEKSKGKKKQKSAQRYWENDGVDEPATLHQTTPGKGGFGFSNNFSYVPLELPSAGKDEPSESPAIESEKPTPELLSKTRELNQRVRENPSDVQAWLALADLQSQQMETSNLTTLNSTAVEKQKKFTKLSMEKKVAVLEQAVEKNPSCIDLIVAYMDVCTETMSSDQILEKWKRTLFTQPQKTLLWKHYLMFCQSTFSAFSFSETLAVYTKCFTTLSAIQSGSFKSHSPEVEMESGMVEIFLQFCQFLKQTGQTEKAVAAFQALIEFNCFCPTSLEQHSVTSAASFFETFWDSDIPRFGEDDACGWSSLMEDKPKTSLSLNEIFPSGAGSNTDESSTQEKILARHSEKTATWLTLEKARDAEQWRAKKTSDEEDDDEDPHRIVLFQDISFVLFKISDENLKFQLLCYFLSFLGIPTDVNSRKSPTVQFERLLHILLEDEKQMKCFEDGNYQLFACSWVNSENPAENHCTSDISMFIRNIFNQSLEIFSESLQAVLAIFWLTFEKNLLQSEANPKQRKQFYKTARKLAKAVLKFEQHRNNVRLWFALVEIEWTYGNLEEARRIVASLLQQLQNFTSTDETMIMRYYHFVRFYCELEMGLGSDNGEKRNEKDSEELKNITLSTISVLVTGGEAQGKIAPSQILKTHKALQEKSIMMLTDFQASYFDAVSRERKEFLVDFMICYALFQYWSIGIDAARQVIDSMLSALGSERSQDGKFNFSGSKDHEEILVFFCNLLQYHSRNNVCPVKPLRNLLLLSLASFPESPFFLHSYVILELRSCLSTSVRRYFHRVLPDSKTPLPWLFAIHYEKQRLEAFQSVTMRPVKVTASKDMEVARPSAVIVLPQTGVLHHLRSLYERAIHHPSARHCVAIWRSYVKFEADNGDLRQAKAIFYQSLQFCAWSKMVYLDAMKIFPESFQDVYDMMEEKEFRIRTPLEELDLLLEDN